MADIEVESVVIRFAGDSGDGMQLTGDRFTSEAAFAGNDLRTFPDFPAEIRAPAGTLAGVSAFQLHFSHESIFTPGDEVDVLVAMNPAALKRHLEGVKPGGVVIANSGQFTKRNLQKAGYESNPLEDDALEGFELIEVDVGKMTATALDDMGLPARVVDRSKNFFALGLLFWMYHRTLDNTIKWINTKFSKHPDVAEANTRTLKAGYYYGETAEVFTHQFSVLPAQLKSGTYRNINGNDALSMGFVAAAERSRRELFLGSYPITPASDILHALSKYKHFGVRTFQAEDEIAAITSAIGAAFGGALALTSTSGPGLALKGEALGLALMVELPLVVVNVQRGGPSTGLPTKTEQSDLFQALFGRNGDAPVPVICARTPSDCFDTAFHAAEIALRYMTPVLVLTDGSIANGTEPWCLPDIDALPSIENHEITDAPDDTPFKPYVRDPETLARPWPRLGSAGLEHRIGGLEKEHIDGGVSYDPLNHEFMTRIRAEKLERIARTIPPTEIVGEQEGDLLLIGWGSTQGAIASAVGRMQRAGKKVGGIALRNLNPLPPDLGDLLKRYTVVACPELNTGQLSMWLRAKYLVDVRSILKVQGRPFGVGELVQRAEALLAGENPSPYLVRTIEHLGTQEDTSFSRYH